MSTSLARRLARYEACGVLLILVAALVPRVRDLRGPFDRELEGWQAAFFTIGAINYERLGLWRAGGYPVINLDLGERGAPGAGLWDEPESWFVYGNHPPLVPLAAWAALQAFGGDDWNQAWREERPPDGIEPIVRLPFLLCHVLGLVAFWWAVREAAGAQRALLALAVLAVTPVSVLYATLVNYENPALLCIALAFGFYARAARSGRARDVAGFALAMGAGAAVTFAPLFFLPPLVVHAFATRGWRKALTFALSGGGPGLLAVCAHGLWWRHSIMALGQPPPAGIWARARELWQPLTSGDAPLHQWAGLQIERSLEWLSPTVVLVAIAGVVVALVGVLRSARTRGRAASAAGGGGGLALAWLAGGLLVQVAFYRHTLDAQHSFLLFLAPGFAALVAVALDALAPMLLRVRAGTGPLVLVTFTLAVPALLQANALRRDLRARPAEADKSLPPLPDTIGRELRGLVPPGSFVVYPETLGWNFAVRYYAWRTLWPAAGPEDQAPRAVARRLGLADAPQWLVLPKLAPPEAWAASALNGSAPSAESATLAAWQLVSERVDHP